MSDITVVPWSRYGKKHLYVKTADGREIGYVDLLTGAVVATVDGFTAELAAIAREHIDGRATSPPNTDRPSADRPPPQPVEDAYVSPASDEPQPDPHVDLSANVAGAAARAKRDEVNAQVPVRNLVARVLGVKTEERAWRVGAKASVPRARRRSVRNSRSCPRAGTCSTRCR